MKRKIYDRLLEWKEKDHGSCAMLLDGARRVGKSYIAELFGKKEYRSYLLIDFAHLPEEVRNIFEHDIADFDMFFDWPYLASGAYKNFRVPPDRSQSGRGR